jgi:hypothetical protein
VTKRGVERRLEQEAEERSGGRQPVLDEPFEWPGTGESMTVGEAIPRWIVTTGCTYNEALARCGVSHRTAERWIYTGGAAHRDIADGKIDPEDLDRFTARNLRFYEAVAAACAEVVVRWQSILELEGRGGYPITKTVVKVKRNAAGDELETVTETTTETARPNVDVITWKMRKQVEFYREKPLIFVGGSPLDVPEPTEPEVAASAVASLERYRESLREKQRAEAIETTATDRPG